MLALDEVLSMAQKLCAAQKKAWCGGGRGRGRRQGGEETSELVGGWATVCRWATRYCRWLLRPMVQCRIVFFFTCTAQYCQVRINCTRLQKNYSMQVCSNRG